MDPNPVSIQTRVVRRTHRSRSFTGGLLLAGLLALAAGSPAGAARLIWERDGLAYLEVADSVSLAAGDSIVFASFDGRGAEAGRAIVLRRDRQGLAQVRVVSGGLKADADIAVMRILPARLTTMTVGYPSPWRANPLFPCGCGTARRANVPQGFRLESAGKKRFRVVRDSLDAAMLPDTLIVQWFDHAADEEIALERGDIDAAVFWPGELSTHMREQSGRDRYERAELPDGLLIARAVTGRGPRHDAPRTPGAGDSLALSQLCSNRFRGDVTAFPVGQPAPPFAPNTVAAPFLGFLSDGACRTEAPFWKSAGGAERRGLEGPGLVLSFVPGHESPELLQTPGLAGILRIGCPVLFRLAAGATPAARVDLLVDLLGAMPAVAPR